jgi:DNA-binding response OmpR family regulator
MLKVMIAEDDLFLANALGAFLADNGYDVCGIAPTVEAGISLGDRHKPDLAVLDVRLFAGGHGKEIAAELMGRGLGVLYVTGNNGALGPWGLAKGDGHACLNKPFQPADLLRALAIVEQLAKGVPPSPPFPGGFHVFD